LTPAAELFVLAHLGLPEIQVENWSLRIDGLVDTPIELTSDALDYSNGKD
jgi:DMSO/TMAO reductase YedYZ molybdopterin-dependent catalytic subunit